MTKNLAKVLLSKAALVAALAVVLWAAAVQPARAASAEIRAAGVYYIDGTGNNPPDINNVYCNWGAKDISDAGLAAYKSGIVNVANHQTNDPWDTSALIEYDQPYKSPLEQNKYPNHCLSLCFDVYCTNKPNGAATYSVAFPLQKIEFDIVKYYGSKGVGNLDTNPPVRIIRESILDNTIVDSDAYYTASAAYQTARTACSKLGEYTVRQATCSGEFKKTYTGACPTKWELERLGLTKDTAAFCTGPSEFSSATVVKKYLNEEQAFLNARDAIELQSQDLSNYMCAAYSCWGSSSDFTKTQTCPSPQIECLPRSSDPMFNKCTTASTTSPEGVKYEPQGYCCRLLNRPDLGWKYALTTRLARGTQKQYGVTCDGNKCYALCGSSGDDINGRETPCVVRAAGTGKGYNEPIRFCTAWDGSYEILGEFGKTNGQFGFVGKVMTDYPGDNMAVGNIKIEEDFIYPADNQYPIQVDVTNVHTVRTSTSVIGTMPAVAATPYNIRYRLSKDADVKMQIYDASAAIPVTQAAGSDSDGNITGSQAGITEGQLVTITTSTVRNLIDWQPRLGEGMKGSEKDGILTESEQWDGRDDNGRLLPAGNYLVSIQAKSQDEWPGTDFSRAVTRQLSLDPLKLTDISVQGLNRQSTAYAIVRSVPTESSNVYFEVYSPGTQFVSDYTRGYEPTGSRPVIALTAKESPSGVLVYSSQVQRERAISYPHRWDGLCHNADGCVIPYPVGTKLPISGDVFSSVSDSTSCQTNNGGKIDGGNCEITFAEGAPLPDGDYVYVLWAEVPYTRPYANGAACWVTTLPGNPHAAAGCAVSIATTGSNGRYTSKVTISGNDSVSVQCAENGKYTAKSLSTATATVPTAFDAICSGVFTGVKTQRYYIGTLPVERGLVEITVQPVGYSTIGSSPTAYGLDPFIFKYSIAREANVNAYVKNTAGVIVKTLTDVGGNTNVAQQMNTLTWDGRDDLGRIVGPGTYLFVVEASDPMFPNAVKNQASAIFPVDLYRLTDLATTDVYGDSGAKATISYMLSKAMNTEIRIYNKDVVIPAAKSSGIETGSTILNTDELAKGKAFVNINGTVYTNAKEALKHDEDKLPETTKEKYTGYDLIWTLDKRKIDNTSLTGVTNLAAGSVTITVDGVSYTNGVDLAVGTTDERVGHYNLAWTVTGPVDGKYTVNLSVWTWEATVVKTAANITWPPRVCNYEKDKAYMKNASGEACPAAASSGCHVDPATQPKCIYVNDISFTNYPADATAAQWNYAEGAAQTLDVRLQPVKTFNRQFTTHPGDGVLIMEEWDAQYFYNPTPLSVEQGGKNTQQAVAACTGATDLTKCPYEMVPDGTYPFYIAARTEEPMDIYYDTTTGAPVRSSNTVVAQTGLYSTDKNVYRLNITRGPVYFLDGSVSVYPNAPQLFNVSSGPVLIPPYEINFSISRAATVEVAIVALKPNMCTTTREDGSSYSQLAYNNKAGDVCKYLSTMTIPNTANFDPNIVRRMFWDGTDNNGKYVKNGNYEVRLIAKNYPDEGLYQPTVKQYTLNVDLLKVFDLLETDAYNINKRGTDMHLSYQVSVPMKVAIQIFKPGTTIYDYQKGTLRDPSTGLEVTNIRDVLVKSIVGFRPSTTLIDEIWDGTDYAQQEVPDGMYPFRFVTALNSADIDSITGEIVGADDSSASEADWKIAKVADTHEYVNLHHATVAIGDGEFVCEDWEKTVFFYPNPFKASNGTMEITKLPVPGKMSIKIYNLAGDLVRTKGFTCVDAQNMQTTLSGSLDVKPDNNVSAEAYTGAMPSLRNAALRCFWDKTNDHGKKVARGVYFGLVDFRAQNGRQHCQKVVKILIPR